MQIYFVIRGNSKLIQDHKKLVSSLASAGSARNQNRSTAFSKQTVLCIRSLDEPHVRFIMCECTFSGSLLSLAYASFENHYRIRKYKRGRLFILPGRI